MSTHTQTPTPHIAVIPSAGIGHLTPFLQLASVLISHNCFVTLVTAKPTISIAESNQISLFLQTYPQIKHIEFDVVTRSSSNPVVDDPFVIQYIALTRSSHPLSSAILSTTAPFSAIICDLFVAKSVADIADGLSTPFYVVCTSSARFLSLLLHLPVLIANANKIMEGEEIEIPGLGLQPKTNIPLPFLNREVSEMLFLSNFVGLYKAKGILLNSFERIESEIIDALNNGRVSSGLSPVLPVGPLTGFKFEKDKNQYLQWLNNQPPESVVYVSFGSRNAMSKDQIYNLRNGLKRSGYRFLWLLKTTKVDRDDKEDLKSLLGDEFLEQTRSQGMVIKGWANQRELLAHPAIGLFISHCGWNSVTEAALEGVPVLAWPIGGDQRINAEVVENAGLGRVDRTWGMGNESVVREEEIASKIKELMEDESVRSEAKKVGEEAKKAVNIGGTSQEVIKKVIQSIS